MLENANKVVNITALKVACQECKVGHLCLPLHLDTKDIQKLDYIVKHKRPLQRNEFVFNAGEPFKSLYVLRSGAAKSYVIDNEGHEQIMAFYLSGDIIGLDAIGKEIYHSFSKTLEVSSVCELPFTELENLAQQLPSLHLQLMRVMSREISNEQQLALMLSKKSAEARIASLLINFSERYYQRGYSATSFQLPMSRGDIANYLGLALETVSRLLTKFQQNHIIKLDRKMVNLTNLSELNKIAQAHNETQSTPSNTKKK